MLENYRFTLKIPSEPQALNKKVKQLNYKMKVGKIYNQTIFLTLSLI